MTPPGLALLLAGSLAAATATMSTAAPLERWTLDDGVMALTPEYNVQHTVGETQAQVVAGFNHANQQQLVRLRPGGAVRVNGHVLPEVQAGNGAWFYKAQVPVREGRFSLALQREPGAAPAAALTYALQLPELAAPAQPLRLQPDGSVRLAAAYQAPGAAVATDHLSLTVHTPAGDWELSAARFKADNPYELDRLPRVDGSDVLLQPLLPRALAPGRYPATLLRQHHVLLGRLAGTDAPGWAKLTRRVAVELLVP